MPREHHIDPPIFVSERSGVTFALSSVEQVIDFARRRGPGAEWRELRTAAFVAVAVPSHENIEAVRLLAVEAFESLR